MWILVDCTQGSILQKTWPSKSDVMVLNLTANIPSHFCHETTISKRSESLASMLWQLWQNDSSTTQHCYSTSEICSSTHRSSKNGGTTWSWLVLNAGHRRCPQTESDSLNFTDFQRYAGTSVFIKAHSVRDSHFVRIGLYSDDHPKIEAFVSVYCSFSSCINPNAVECVV